LAKAQTPEAGSQKALFKGCNRRALMKKSEIVELRASDISLIRKRADSFVESIQKENLSAILMSGSVARGDFFPGRLGGMTDLTVFKKPGSSATAEGLFGRNEDPDIPYHCVHRKGDWYQIWFIEMLNAEGYRRLPEARKYALNESVLLWEDDDSYSQATSDFSKIAAEETRVAFGARLNGISYLLSEYKVDRWHRRNEPGQLHFNLNVAIDIAIGCLYNLNGKYTPAPDRALYYSYELDKQPPSYEELLQGLMAIKLDSMANYEGREQLFRAEFLKFLSESQPI
jgi:hypothetical protein